MARPYRMRPGSPQGRFLCLISQASIRLLWRALASITTFCLDWRHLGDRLSKARIRQRSKALLPKLPTAALRQRQLHVISLINSDRHVPGARRIIKLSDGRARYRRFRSILSEEFRIGSTALQSKTKLALLPFVDLPMPNLTMVSSIVVCKTGAVRASCHTLRRNQQASTPHVTAASTTVGKSPLNSTSMGCLASYQPPERQDLGFPTISGVSQHTTTTPDAVITSTIRANGTVPTGLFSNFKISVPGEPRTDCMTTTWRAIHRAICLVVLMGSNCRLGKVRCCRIMPGNGIRREFYFVATSFISLPIYARD